MQNLREGSFEALVVTRSTFSNEKSAVPVPQNKSSVSNQETEDTHNIASCSNHQPTQHTVHCYEDEGPGKFHLLKIGTLG